MVLLKKTSIALILTVCASQSLAYIGPCLPVTKNDLKKLQNKDNLFDLPRGGKGATQWQMSPEGYTISRYDRDDIKLYGGLEVWQKNFVRVEYDLKEPGDKVTATQWFYLDRYNPCLVRLGYERVAGGQIYHVSGSD